MSEIDTLQIARSLLDAHRRIGRHLPNGLFGDPALLMLLDLYVAAAPGRALTVGACCVATGVPHTTALRWLRTLEQSALVERTPHPQDSRSRLVRLAPMARGALGQWLAEVARRNGWADIAARPAD